MTEPEDLNDVPEAVEGGGKSGDAAFEAGLRRAMRRVEVRADLTGRLFALAAQAEQQRVAAGGGPRVVRLASGARVLAMPRRTAAWISSAIAAALVAGIFVGQHEYVRHEKRVIAERQFETATRITNQALEQTRQQLQQQGIDLDGGQ